MVDTKVTQLTEDTAPVGTDLVLTVDDPAGTPISKKAQLLNLFPAISGFGGISTIGASTAQAGISGATKLTGFTADMAASAAVTPAHASDKLTLVRTGKYLVLFSVSFEGTADNEMLLQAYVNAVAAASVAARHTLRATGTMTQNVCGFGVVSATAGHDLDLRVTPTGTADFTLVDGQLVAIFLGP